MNGIIQGTKKETNEFSSQVIVGSNIVGTFTADNLVNAAGLALDHFFQNSIEVAVIRVFKGHKQIERFDISKA